MLTNYKETIFPRQVGDQNGDWIPQYSPVIMWNNLCPSASVPQGPAGPVTRSRSASLLGRNLAALIRRCLLYFQTCKWREACRQQHAESAVVQKMIFG